MSSFDRRGNWDLSEIKTLAYNLQFVVRPEIEQKSGNTEV